MSANRSFDDGGFDARERTLLTAQEQRAIEQLDRQLEGEDPDLAGRLRKMRARRRLLPSWRHHHGTD